jgi:uncharacterized protein (DUF934 family)
VLVSLAQWQAHRSTLLSRSSPFGIWLASDQHPQAIEQDLPHFAVVALEFPRFRDGRAYTYARLLRERYAYRGELRAIGDVLPDQLHLMLRAGFDAFELAPPHTFAAYRAAEASFSVWYQPTGDGRATALELRGAARRASHAERR